MRIPAILIALPALFLLGAAWAGPEDEIAGQLLSQALDNQYHGRYQATLELIHDDFARGKDSLAGFAEFADDVGERKMCLAGSRRAFEYKSKGFGREQWITDEETRRVRRIANRQWKKGVFGTLLTYEDMLKLPADFFLEFAACKSMLITDTSYRISMTLKPIYESFYGRLDVELSKHPVLVKAMDFYGTHGEHLKSLQVKAYKEMEGKWMPTEICLADGDSLSSLKMCFRNFSFTGPPLPRIERGQYTLMSKRPEPQDEEPGPDAQGEGSGEPGN